MKSTPWDSFFEECVRRMFRPGALILDIGAGLRVDATRGNREDPTRAWIKPLLAQARYRVLDTVSTYHPDLVGDVMNLSLPDASYDAVICLAVLEHVPRPWDAIRELHRILKPGGQMLLYAPFLSPYHALNGYYGDYFRYTEDGLRALCSAFQGVEIVPVRGPVETLAHLIPGRQRLLRRLGRWIDALRPSSGKQVSGYYLFAIK